MAIARAQFVRRLERLQGKLPEHQLDAVLVSSQENVYYLSGVVCHPLERPFFLVVRRAGPPRFLVPALERGHIRRKTPWDVQSYWEYPAPPGQQWEDQLQHVLAGAKHVAVEPTLRCEISDALRDYCLSPLPLVEQLRIIKSPAEIKAIDQAARFARLGVDRLLARSYYGSQVLGGFVETRTVLKQVIRASRTFNPLLTKVVMGTWAAPRSADPHSIPQIEDVLARGPHIALALTSVRGYAAECERTYFTATPLDEHRRAFNAMLVVRKLALDMIRPGVACADIDAAARESLAKAGYGEYVLHRTGHGLGLAYHAEAPWLAEGSADVLAAGMVVSVEPGIYLPGEGGLRHSDTVLVTDSGPKLLGGEYPTDLDDLIVTAWKPYARLLDKLAKLSLYGCLPLGRRMSFIRP